jgi:VWFA-related protein
VRSKALLKYHLPWILVSALLLLVLISAPDSILGQQPTPNSKTILLRVTATDDHNRPITGLKREQFSIFEKTQQLDIASFDSSDEPASIAFMFDLSGSIPDAFKNLAAQLVQQFIETSNKSNDYLVIAFNTQAKVLCGWDCRADDLKKALGEIVRVTPQMNTAFYDACDLALTKLESSKYRRRVIIVFTDEAGDNASKTSLSRLRNILRESSVALYALGIIHQSNDGSTLGIPGRGILEELASVSGGRAFFSPDHKQLRDVVAVVVSQLRDQYTITFNVAPATRDNKWHSIKVKVAPPREESRGKFPKVFLRYREGYYDH